MMTPYIIAKTQAQFTSLVLEGLLRQNSGMRILMLLLGWLPFVVVAAPQSFKIQPVGEGSTHVEFTLPYTLGEHRGIVKKISGSVRFDPAKRAIRKAKFRVPIRSIEMQADEKREELQCHFLEALGLNYDAADYPRIHACDANNKLPKEGANSIRYSHVEFRLDQLVFPEDAEVTVGSKFMVTAKGTWKIHGVSREMSNEFEIEFPKGDWSQFIVRGEQKLWLPKFNVEVKPVAFIKASREAMVRMTLYFARK